MRCRNCHLQPCPGGDGRADEGMDAICGPVQWPTTLGREGEFGLCGMSCGGLVDVVGREASGNICRLYNVTGVRGGVTEAYVR